MLNSTSSVSDEETTTILLYYHFFKKKRLQNRKRKSVWVRELYLHREQEGEFFLTYPTLIRDPLKFQNYYRMSITCFQKLVSLIKPYFHVGHTNFRKSIGFLERLTVTIRYLANGESFASSSYRFKISPNEISIIITAMLKTITEVLRDVYIEQPNENSWRKIAAEFQKKKYFPNCIGAVDGKHIRIKKPNNAGSLYFNYKHYHSTVLLSVVDSSYKFVIVDIGAMGKNSDAGIFDASVFGKQFKEGYLNLPPPTPIEENGPPTPFVFVGDEAFRLTENFMKPYPRRHLAEEKRIFNYRLSFARAIVECTYGILVSKFRIFETPIGVHPEKVDNIVMASILLHNMIRQEDKIKVSNEDFELLPKAFGAFQTFTRNSTQLSKKTNVNQSTSRARSIRDYFCTYFCNAGQVEWQNTKIMDTSSNDSDV